ncbi:sulfatase-like hydrolase/transferase [Vagococcus fluvialis]|uniref:sulfatase-like hydrolase/transferase n=1 Tax=Vagococcus fluvialis TaxID=2738 RepID=UPI003B5B3C9A
MEKPNILFILTDQQRKDTLSAYGQLISETPHLDKLSEESVVFENAYTTCPICTPARATIQTGLYPIHHGMITNSYNYGNMVQELADTASLLSRRLEAIGYTPGYTGKWHLGTGVNNVKNDWYIQQYMGDIEFAEFKLKNDSVPTHHGYQGDDFPGHGFGGYIYDEYKAYLKERDLTLEFGEIIKGHYGDHQAAAILSGIETSIEHFLIERTKTLIDSFEEGKPWYFQLNFWGPHEPYYAPKEFVELYEDKSIKPWQNFSGDSPNKPKIHQVKKGNISSFEDVEPFVKYYFSCVSHIDYQIGRLLDYLKDKGIYDETMVIFSADHGESLGIHGGLCDKALFMYEETCSIPLFIKKPFQDSKKQVFELVSNVDLYSTILNYAGYSSEESQRDGQSLKPLLEDQPVEWRDTVVTECSGIGSILYSQRMIRKKEYKYIFNAGDTDELYDLNNDPYELINQIDNKEYHEILSDMKLSLLEWMETNNDNLINEYRLLALR